MTGFEHHFDNPALIEIARIESRVSDSTKSDTRWSVVEAGATGRGRGMELDGDWRRREEDGGQRRK
jgi:hypothetical protein